MRIALGLAFLLLGSALTGQSFSNVAPSLGITGGYGSYTLAAGGVSFVDFDLDGLDDLTFCTMNTQPMKFYKNTGTSFTLVDPPYVDNTQQTKQALWADIDNDGDLDLFIVAFDGYSRLYQNTGSMTFTEITSSAGLPTGTNKTFGANFGDYDRDGFLDLYVTNYGINGAGGYGLPNFLYHNNGDLTFTDVTTATGTSNGNQQSFCSTFFDYDNNGTSDLYVVNDRFDFPNALYAVSTNGTFTDVSDTSGSDIQIWAMNGGVGDYNNDGYLDVYVTNSHIGGNHSWLMHNHGDGTFADSAAAAGVLFNRFGWGGNFFDFDNDCDEDLYVCCSQFGLNGSPNAMYVNQGTGVYTEPLFATGGLGGIDTMHSFSNAIGDYNNDGKLDIVVSNAKWGTIEYPFVLWKNEESNSNNWLKINLTGQQSNRDAVGTMLEFWIGCTKYIRFTYTSNAFLCQNARTITFGLGTATALDSLKIIWPSMNSIDVIPGADLTINQVNSIVETCAGNMVTNNQDGGSGSLRRVLECVADGDTVFFDNALAGDTILITSAILSLAKDVVLFSNLSPRINLMSSISGALEIPGSQQVQIHHLNIISGISGDPAAVVNMGDLQLFDTNIIRNTGLALNSRLVKNLGTLTVHDNCAIEQ